jgi:hypothetical protein
MPRKTCETRNRLTDSDGLLSPLMLWLVKTGNDIFNFLGLKFLQCVYSYGRDLAQIRPKCDSSKMEGIILKAILGTNATNAPKGVAAWFQFPMLVIIQIQGTIEVARSKIGAEN